MKGQMFVVTMVFLIALIFTVQANLSQYGTIDLAKTFESNDLPLLKSVQQSFEAAVQSAVSCPDLDQKSLQLKQFIERQVIRGTTVDITILELNCNNWQTGSTLLKVRAHLRSFGVDTTETLSFSN